MKPHEALARFIAGRLKDNIEDNAIYQRVCENSCCDAEVNHTPFQDYLEDANTMKRFLAVALKELTKRNVAYSELKPEDPEVKKEQVWERFIGLRRCIAWWFAMESTILAADHPMPRFYHEPVIALEEIAAHLGFEKPENNETTGN